MPENQKKYVHRIPREDCAEPKDYFKQSFSCYDFFNSVYKFLMGNFEGAITIDFPKSFKGAVNVSPRGFAYFIRVLLTEIFGNALVRGEFNIYDGEVVFSLKVPITLKCLPELKSIAQKSGFSFEAEEGSITLRTKCIEDTMLYVYAQDKLSFINYLYEVFLTPAK